MHQTEPAKSRWGNSEKLTLECATKEPVEGAWSSWMSAARAWWASREQGLGWPGLETSGGSGLNPLFGRENKCVRVAAVAALFLLPTTSNHLERNRGSPDGPEYLIEVPPAQPSAPQVPLDKGCIPYLHPPMSARRGESAGDLPVLCVSLSASPVLAAHHGYLRLGVLGQILPVWHQSYPRVTAQFQVATSGPSPPLVRTPSSAHCVSFLST